MLDPLYGIIVSINYDIGVNLMNNKRIRKWNKISPWYFEEYISWLNEMGAQGMHLVKTKAFVTHFEKDDSRVTSYACSYIDKGIKEVIKKHRIDCGWKYICSSQHLHFYDVSEAMLQKKSDFEGEQFHDVVFYEKIAKRFKWLALMFVLIIVYLGGLVYWSSDYSLYRSNMSMNMVFMVVIYTFSAHEHRGAWLYSKGLIKRIRSGDMLHFNVDYRKLARQNNWRLGLVLGITLLFLGFMINDISSFNNLSYYSPVPEGVLPVLRIEDVLVDKDYEWHIRLNDDGFDRENNFIKETSLLMPAQYELEQSVYYSDQMWGDGSGVYAPSINSKKFEALTPWMAKDFFNKYSKKRFDEYIPYETDYFEALLVHIRDESLSLIAHKGKNVYVIRYYGKEKLDFILSALERKIDEEL